MTPSTPWTRSASDLLHELGSSERGLSHSEAKKRLSAEGPNDIAQERAVPAWRILLNQFKSPLVLVLITASVISFALGEQTETAIILIVVFLSGLLAFVQEYRSERALRSLRKKLTRRAMVIRDGASHRIDARDLVIGDIVELDLGTVVAADLRLFRIEDLEIDESSLTGESVPVPKTVEIVAGEHDAPQEQTNMAFLGTHVVQGSGLGIVVATGSRTELGRTASLLNAKPEETDFQKGIRQFGNFLLKVTLGLTIIVAAFLGFLHGTWAESLLFALALAVGISPELLPVIVTVSLSRGALLMSRKHVLVKRLISIEDLGNADVFCTDKTGTLTVGTPRVRGSIDANGDPSDLPLSLALNCMELTKKGKATSSVDEALLAAKGRGTADLAYPNGTVYDIVSFDFNRRRMSCIVGAKDGTRRLIVKGAVKEVLDATSLGASERARLNAFADTYHTRGIRLVAVAERTIRTQKAYSPADEKELELAGFVLIGDAPKETAKAALLDLDALHVRILILTGDNEHVTSHVASQIGFAVTGIRTGDEIEQMDDHELADAAETSNVFARITPSHKLRIIQALKRNGHTVGYMGDGVNDAPALRASDVGISFDDAIDVAKEAAEVILMQKKLSVLADGIREGRRTFANMRTYIRTTISSNFGNMLSVAGSAMLLPFIPLLPAQILLLNLLSDIPMLAISTDRVSDEDVARPQKWDIRQISNFMYFFGTISSFADYATFALLLFVAHANIPLFRSGWFLESLITEVAVIFILRSRKLSRSNLPAWPLVAASAFALLTTLVITQTTFGAPFAFVPIDGRTLGLIALIVIGYAIVTQFGKAAYARLWTQTLKKS